MGMSLMRHRTTLIGGRFELSRPPDGGTRLECVLPMALALNRGAS
jgi:signal transduction histidine kinase